MPSIITSKNLDIVFVKNRLLEEERKREVISSENPDENIAMKATFKFKCHHCGKVGHKKKNCFKWKREQSGKNVNLSNTEIRASCRFLYKVLIEDTF